VMTMMATREGGRSMYSGDVRTWCQQQRACFALLCSCVPTMRIISRSRRLSDSWGFLFLDGAEARWRLMVLRNAAIRAAPCVFQGEINFQPRPYFHLMVALCEREKFYSIWLFVFYRRESRRLISDRLNALLDQFFPLLNFSFVCSHSPQTHPSGG